MLGESGAAVHRLVGRPGDLYLKYGEGALADAVAMEDVRLRWLADRLPAAPFVAMHVERGRAWLLTGALKGRSGDDWLEHDPALLPRVIAAHAEAMLALHALPADACPFRAHLALRLDDARALVAGGAVDEDDFAAENLGRSAASLLAEVERLAPLVLGGVVTHGDCSLGNLILDADMRPLGWIDVGRLGLADPYQDIAILWENLDDFGPEAQAMLFEALGIAAPDMERLKLCRLLDELF